MTKKTKFITAVAVLVAVLMVAGVSTAIASGVYGTQSDPLVALSYINDTYTPDILGQMQSAAEDAAKGHAAMIESKVDIYAAETEALLASSQGIPATDVFSVVTLSKGQQLTCAVGTELLLRIGTAVTYGGTGPILVNTTAGSTLDTPGLGIVANNMYLVTIQNNGIRATSGTVKVLVRGSYTIE